MKETVKEKNRIRRSVLRSRLINGWIERRIDERMNSDNDEHCIACSDIIPEGRQICKVCEKN